MSVLPLKISRRYFLFSFALLTGFLCAPNARAAVPAIVIDSQQAIGSGYNNPQSIAVSKNGTIFVADSDNNQIVALTSALPFPGDNAPVSTTPYVLTAPKALAMDANGNLYVGDSPAAGGRIVELLGDGTGNLTGQTKLIFSGTPLTNPVSLAFDSTGTLFIGDYNTTVNPTVGSIFSLAPAGTTLTTLSLGLPGTINPAALVRDSSTNLYIANFAGASNSVYEASLTTNTSQVVATQSFVINQPSGLALDASGNLYILSLLGTGTGYNAGEQVVEVPASSPTTPYLLPNYGLGTARGMVVDSSGNVDIADSSDGIVFQLGFDATYMGYALVTQVGPEVAFNFEFNAPATLRGFQITSEGDVSTELTQSTGGNCVNGNHNNLPRGGPAISPYYPYTCDEIFVASPAYPGTRTSGIEIRGANGTILGSTPVYQYGFSGADTTYPLNSHYTVTNLQQPQAIAISGLDKTVYVADTLASQVYSIRGLTGTTLTPVSTGTIALSSPIALALDGPGNLYIADFDNGNLIEVPNTATGIAPFLINTGGLLQHPISLALDYLGNLYIGDAGPGGFNASSGNPGYIVEIPVGGKPSKITIPSVPIVYPQALATDPYVGNLTIGDGGDPSGVGQLVQLSADKTTANVVALDNVTNPVGLGFDPAGDLYVLDGTANWIVVAPAASSGGAPYVLPFDNTMLLGAGSLGVSNGGQSFIIGNIGNSNTNFLVYVNGNNSTSSFGNVPVGTTSDPQTAIVVNIGNSDMTLSAPYNTVNPTNPAFDLSTSECADNLVISPSGACTVMATFSPTTTGQATQQITVKSDAYNSGTPIITMQGTGTAAGPAVKPGRKRGR